MTKTVGELQVTISEIELEYGVNAGINLHSLSNGLVPVFEEHEARLEAHYDVDEWYELSSMERALIVAQRRLRISMKNLQSEAEIRKSIQDSKKGART